MIIMKNKKVNSAFDSGELKHYSIIPNIILTSDMLKKNYKVLFPK